MRASKASLLILIVMLSGLGVLAGCKPAEPPEVRAAIFYPPAPDPPRLQFLLSFNDPHEWQGRKKSSFSDFIVGAEQTVEGEIETPYGIAVRDGKMYICDLGAHAVHVIDARNKTYSTLGARGQVKNPVNITIAPDGTKYVCDVGKHQVLVFDAHDQFVRAMGDPQQAGASDLAILGNELIITDITGGEVEAWSKDGEFLRLIAKKGKGPSELMMPTNVAIGMDGQILVSDTGKSIVNMYSPEGSYLGSIGGPGDRPGYFARPKGLAVDPAGRIYVADAQWEKIQIFAPDGSLLLFFGGASPTPEGMGMPASIYIDSTSLQDFAQYIDDDFEAEYLLFVVNQYGKNKIGVYAYGKSRTADYTPKPPPTTQPAATEDASTAPPATE